MAGEVEVTMRVSPETVDLVEYLEARMQCWNRTDAVVRALRLTDSILKEMDQGARIEVHRRNGEVRELLFK